MRFNKLFCLGLLATAAFSSCGKPFSGNYTGLSSNASTVANSGATNGTYSYSQYNTYAAQGTIQGQVSLSLSQNGDIVSGTYTDKTTNETGSFNAVSTSSNSLQNITLSLQMNSGSTTNSYANMGATTASYCYSNSAVNSYVGTLSSTDNGKQISGTLNATGVNAANSMCANKSLQLYRSN